MADKIFKGLKFPGMNDYYVLPEAVITKNEDGIIEIESMIASDANVGTDASLSTSGMAADAKAVGNALSNKASESFVLAKIAEAQLEGSDVDLSGYVVKDNPVVTGSFSMNRKANTVIGDYSVAEGQATTASSLGAHAEGYYTKASGEFQHVEGKYNIEDTNDVYAHIVGNGTGENARSNAHTLDWDGNAWFAGAIEAKNISNPNLLDNWYFAKAVNQRGAESYWEEGFTIDRWKFGLWQSSGAYVFPTKSDVTLHNETATDTACSCYIEQTLENPKYLAGKTVTFSAKLRTTTSVSGKPILRIYTDNGVFKSDYLKTSDGGKIVTLTATLPTNITTLAVGIGAFANYAGSGNFNLAIESVKLEVGAVSTLANDVPPKYSEQLRECQRYYIRWYNSEKLQAFTGGASGTAVYAAVQLPVAMRGTDAPQITYSGIDIYPFVSNGVIAAKSCGGNMIGSRNNIVLWATYDKTSDCPAQTPATIRIGAGGYIDLSCEI